MELGFIKRGRWRPLCPLTGRVQGSHRRPKMAMMRDEVVQEVPLSTALNVEPTRRLYWSPSPSPSQQRFDDAVNGNGNDADMQIATDPESRESSSAASLNADRSSASGGWSPLADMCKHVGVQTDDETSQSRPTSRHADAQTPWTVWRSLADEPRHVGVQTDDLRSPSRASSRDADVSNTENRRTSKEAGDVHTAAASCAAGGGAAGGGAAGAGGGNDWHELLVDAQDVRLLRRYARNHHDAGIDLERFDRDERYKANVFFRWHPLVRVERCPHLAKLLQDRNNPQATEYFARQLGLCSTVDNGSEARSGDTGGHDAGGRQQPPCPGSRVSKRKSGRTRREYSVEEGRALVRWLLAKEGRARCVNGNRLWRELEPAFTTLVGTRRSWHSLRNRYLRYLLPALDSPALQLQPFDARRLREGAALGEMRGRRRELRGSSPPAAPAPRGASSRAPLAVRRLAPSLRAPADVRPAQGGQQSQLPQSSGAQQAPRRSPRSSGAQQAPRSSGAQQAPRSSGAQQAPRSSGAQQAPRSSGAQQAPRRSPRSSGAQQAPRSSGAQQAPRSSGAQQAPRRSPRSSGAQQAPRSSGAQQAPRSSGAQQAPRRSPRFARDEPVAMTVDVVEADGTAAPHGKRRLYTPRA